MEKNSNNNTMNKKGNLQFKAKNILNNSLSLCYLYFFIKQKQIILEEIIQKIKKIQMKYWILFLIWIQKGKKKMITIKILQMI